MGLLANKYVMGGIGCLIVLAAIAFGEWTLYRHGYDAGKQSMVSEIAQLHASLASAQSALSQVDAETLAAHKRAQAVQAHAAASAKQVEASARAARKAETNWQLSLAHKSAQSAVMQAHLPTSICPTPTTCQY